MTHSPHHHPRINLDEEGERLHGHGVAVLCNDRWRNGSRDREAGSTRHHSKQVKDNREAVHRFVATYGRDGVESECMRKVSPQAVFVARIQERHINGCANIMIPKLLGNMAVSSSPAREIPAVVGLAAKHSGDRKVPPSNNDGGPCPEHDQSADFEGQRDRHCQQSIHAREHLLV